ncbi:Signal peptidase I [Nymphon striatum]|nr:Signal peptidase I [Nymphon striatum]
MLPTLEVGDRLITDKTAYGWSRHSMMIDPGFKLPGENGRIAGTVPARGDVVTFTHPKDQETYIKRVIALPGDSIAVQNGRLIINGKMVLRTYQKTYSYREYQGRVVTVDMYDEALPGGHTHTIVEQSDNGFSDFMPKRTIPDGHVFVMGDNRDNSSDSRFSSLGFVPIENIQGRARMISYSLYDCDQELGLNCAKRRYFSKIE